MKSSKEKISEIKGSDPIIEQVEAVGSKKKRSAIDSGIYFVVV